jgi:hypothetical protein
MKRLKELRKQISLFVWIAVVGTILITTFLLLFCFFHGFHFVENLNYQATIVTALVAIFVLYFVLVQLTYSVTEIPTGILLKYALETWESWGFIIYFFIAIFFSAIFAFQKLCVIGYWILTVILILSLAITIKYLFWFVKRMSVKEILKLIKIKTKKGLGKLNELEQNIAPNDIAFQSFLADNPNWRYDPEFIQYIRPLLPSTLPFYTLQVRGKGDLFIKEINFTKIQQELKEICSDTHVKVIFDVRPSSPLSKESSPLFTLLYDEPSSERHEDYLKAKKEFIGRLATSFEAKDGGVQNPDIDEEITRILKKAAETCINFFARGKYEEWWSPVDIALQDLKEMTTYAIKREEELEQLCQTFHEMIFDQLFAINPEVYLELKKRVFSEIMEAAREINQYALNKQNVQFLDKMIEIFYKLTYFKVAPSRNRDLFQQIFSQLDSLHSQFIITPYQRFYPTMTSLILIITEWLRFLREDFEKENQADTLDSFYMPVVQDAIKKSFNIIKRSIHWFKADQTEYFRIYLREQMQQFIDMLQFQKERPHYYFTNPSHYYRIKFALDSGQAVDCQDRQQYELANQKAEIIKQLKRQLQYKIVQLSVYMVYKFTQKEIPSEFVWKVALPAANVSYSYYGLRHDSDLTELYNDFVFHRQATEMFDFIEIHPSSPSPVGTSNIVNTFWVLLNIYRLQSGENPLPSKTSKELKEGLLNSLNSMEVGTWAEAVNMSTDEFEILKQRYREYVSNRIQVTDAT